MPKSIEDVLVLQFPIELIENKEVGWFFPSSSVIIRTSQEIPESAAESAHSWFYLIVEKRTNGCGHFESCISLPFVELALVWRELTHFDIAWVRVGNNLIMIANFPSILIFQIL